MNPSLKAIYRIAPKIGFRTDDVKQEIFEEKLNKRNKRLGNRR